MLWTYSDMDISCLREPQRRLYTLDARGLQPVHEWVVGFEQFWNERLDRLNDYVKKLQDEQPNVRTK